MNNFIILPNQIFDLKYYNKKYNYIIYEHPQYITKYNFNKKKLILHRASMRHLYDSMKKKNYDVKYVDYKTPLKFSKSIEYTMYDPIDKLEINNNNVNIIESPNFLCNLDLFKKYRKKTDKFFFSNFYKFMKNELDIIKNIKSKDKDNRKRLPKDVDVPSLPNIKECKYIKEAIKYVNSNFKKNYGTTEKYNYPIKSSDAKIFLNDFIKKRFKLFGDYEDFFDDDDNHNYLYHSVLSSSINIGLINPIDIILNIEKFKNKIPINSYEGYIRQLFWREYQRYCYIYFDFNNLNYFNNTKKLNNSWYTGKLNCKPVDHCIIKAFDIAYLHHIERLMVIGNYMMLNRINPKEGFRWFMEFSIDSYEWVMHQNVLDMVFFVSGGKTMRKPYISSSNYILKMSYYKKGEWSEEWDKLFHLFIKNNKEKMRKFTYSYPIVKKYL